MTFDPERGIAEIERTDTSPTGRVTYISRTTVNMGWLGIICGALIGSWLGYELGHMRGKTYGYSKCVAEEDDDRPLYSKNYPFEVPR